MLAFSVKMLAVIQTKDFFKHFEVKSYTGTRKDTEQHIILDRKMRRKNLGKYLR